MNPADIDSKQRSQFWTALHSELQRLEIPMALHDDSCADVGWGRGMRILIDGNGMISHPSGRRLFLYGADVLQLAADIKAAFRLTRRERQVLNMLRDGVETYRHRSQKTVKVGEQIVRESTLENLCHLGLVQELAYGNDSEYVAVQPESVHRKN